MKIYVYDIDSNEVISQEFGDIANLQSFESEMNEIYDYWFYDENEAHELVQDKRIIFIKEKLFNKLKHNIIWRKSSKKYTYSINDGVVKLNIVIFGNGSALDGLLNRYKIGA